jgi:hypothetical protein
MYEVVFIMYRRYIVVPRTGDSSINYVIKKKIDKMFPRAIIILRFFGSVFVAPCKTPKINRFQQKQVRCVAACRSCAVFLSHVLHIRPERGELRNYVGIGRRECSICYGYSRASVNTATRIRNSLPAFANWIKPEVNASPQQPSR